MALRQLFSVHRTAIVERWRDEVLGTYPSDGASFFRTEHDGFRNPVGNAVLHSLEVLFDHLAGTADEQAAGKALDDLVRIRAVQGFTPARALGCLLKVKAIVREEVGDEATSDLIAFEAHVDELLLRAFDTFVTCREKVFSLRVQEARAQVFSLLRQAGLVVEEGE
jgi:hypothetical protein